MELPFATYLYTLALIAIAYVGFTAIVLILRQSLGVALSFREKRGGQKDGQGDSNPAPGRQTQQAGCFTPCRLTA